MSHLPCKRKIHQTEHRTCQQSYRVWSVEKLYRNVLNLLLVDHSEMHSVIHIILAQRVGSAVDGRHSRTQPGE